MSSFKELIKHVNDEPQDLADDTHTLEEHYYDADLLPMPDDIANLILMHRNAHFGGKFAFMLEYYQNEGPGCCTEFDFFNIQKLAEIEEKVGQDLSAVRLSKTEQKQIKNVLQLYQGLRKLHSIAQDANSIPSLLSDLILTEEHDPKAEIIQLSKNEKASHYLIDILRSEEFLDPLFPGYGKTPTHAATSLGLMKGEKAIVPLFESIKVDHFQHEEAVISALKNIGAPAFDFLMQVLQNEPFTHDNEKAAICLISFGENTTFAKAALEILHNSHVLNLPNLVVHLVLACLGLKDKKDIERFIKVESQLPNAYGPDFQYVSSKLKKKCN